MKKILYSLLLISSFANAAQKDDDGPNIENREEKELERDYERCVDEAEYKSFFKHGRSHPEFNEVGHARFKVACNKCLLTYALRMFRLIGKR